MKSQAETAGRLGNSIGARPQKGTVLRDLEITTADGTRRLLSSLRSTSNLVMILAAGQDLSAFLAALLARKSALADNNGRVLVIATKPVRLAETVKWLNDFCLLAIDENCELHRALGATDSAHIPIPTIYITDRFGEVFAAFQTTGAASFPSIDEIIHWLEFIERQCEECSPPEWPE
jgi:hypothetical protein